MVFRLIASLLVIALIVCVGAYWFSGNKRYLTWAIRIFKLAVLSAALFFALLFLERLLARL